MAVEELSIASLPDLVAQVLTLRDGLQTQGFLWFRGVECDRHDLVPKLMRDGKTSDEVFERERRLLTRFRQRSMPYWPGGYPQTDWEHLFAMQHYGFPTRLLDWSENVFVAAHFALVAEPHEHADGNPCTPVIWCVDPVGWNRSTPLLSEYGDTVYVLTTADEELDAYRPDTTKKRPATPVALFGAHNSNRIVAQRGTFFVWGKDVKGISEFDLPGTGSTLWKVRLTGDRAQLSIDLQALGFSETMVFPELAYLAKELTRMEGWRT